MAASLGIKNRTRSVRAESASLLAPHVEKEVPKELTMAYKDELGKQKARAEEDGESAELAEGFVQTVPIESAPAHPVTSYPPAQPLQSAPRPTGAVPRATEPRVALQNRVNSNDGVPRWVDKAIVGILACLLVMVLKLALRI